VNPYLKLIRIHNVVGASIGDFAGYVVASHWHLLPERLLLSMLVVALVAMGGYVINDVFDVEIDKINKPDRPIPSGQVSLRNATLLAYSGFAFGTAISIVLGYLQALVSAITSLLLYWYARSLKRAGLPGNLVVALTTALSLFYGGLAYYQGNWAALVFIPTAYSFLLTLAREIVKGIEDYVGDKAYGVRTLATTLGVERAWDVAKALLLVVLITSPLPYFLGFSVIYLILMVPFWYLTLKSLLQPKTIEGGGKARAYLKGSAFIGIVAFALGAVPLDLLVNHFP
jgi:geranylgeranylglycerol-phosphate geranylgeranyltransferase